MRTVISFVVAWAVFLTIVFLLAAIGSDAPAESAIVGVAVYLLAQDFRREFWGESA